MTETQLFVANVNAIIEAEGLSVSEIARRAGVQRAELSRFLNGQTDATITRSAKIAKAVGVSLGVLLSRRIEVAMSR